MKWAEVLRNLENSSLIYNFVKYKLLTARRNQKCFCDQLETLIREYNVFLPCTILRCRYSRNYFVRLLQMILRTLSHAGRIQTMYWMDIQTPVTEIYSLGEHLMSFISIPTLNSLQST
jgi:hypothetical protein